MRHAFTLFLLAWGGVLLVMALVKLAQGKAFSDVAAIGCMGLLGIGLAAWAWSFMGRLQREAKEERPPAVAVVKPPKVVPVEGSIALVRQMAAHLLTALAVWLWVVVLASLAGVVFLRDTTYAFTTGLLRFGSLFWKCFLIALGVELILWLAHFGWVNDEPGPAWFSKVVAFAFGALPVVVGVLGAISLANHEDPWSALPGGPPFGLREFASRHPQLHIETVGVLGGREVAVTRGSSPRVIYSEWDLLGTKLSWEKCTDAGEPEGLGGPPPFPHSRCLARIQIRKPDYDAVSEEDLDRGVAPPEIRNVRYVYSAGWAYTTEVTQHFLNWAKSLGQDPNLYGYRRYWMEVTAGGKKWTIWIRGVKRTVEDVYVEYTEGGGPPAQTQDE